MLTRFSYYHLIYKYTCSSKVSIRLGLLSYLLIIRFKYITLF